MKLNSVVSVLWASHMSDDRFLVSGGCALISFPRHFHTVTKAHPASYLTCTPEGSSPEHAKPRVWKWRFSSEGYRVQECMNLQLRVTVNHTSSWRGPKLSAATNLPLPSPFVILTNKNKRSWSYDAFVWSLGCFLFHAVKFRMHYALLYCYCPCDFVFVEKNVRSEGRVNRGVEKTT